MAGVPTKFKYRYYHLGIATLAVLLLDIAVIRGYTEVTFLSAYEGLLIYLFMFLSAIYAFLEMRNVLDSIRHGGPKYTFNRNGIYRGRLLVADWAAVSGITILREKVVNTINNEGTISQSGNWFMKRS